ncbi:MAG: glycosyltransferase family 39 protein, partial [Acidimicrobiales bacterium]
MASGRVAVGEADDETRPPETPAAQPSLSVVQQRRWCTAIALLAIAAGVLTAISVLPGLPSDEPAHWLNVIYYGAHHHLPRVGNPGTSYEAVQGPVAYVFLAVVAGTVRAITSNPELPFFAARILDGIELLVTAVVLWRLLVRLVPPSPGRVVALACFVLSPMLVAMSWSVENDIAAVLLSFLVLDLVLSRQASDGLDARWSLLAGLLTGVALVTKLTAWPLVVSVPLWIFFRPGVARETRPAIGLALAFWVGAAVASG